jgi:hypothetical protein
MPITLNGTTGITTPGLINTGSTTFVDLTTTGNTILGDASTDTLNVANGNLVLNSSGNLGIGTASPASKLHIQSATGTAETLIKLQTAFSNPSGNKSIVWADNSNTLGAIAVNYSAPQTSMTFGSLYNSGYNTTDLMTLTPTGLGIGTSSPDQKLTIDGGGAGFNRVNSDLTPANDSKGLIFVRTNGNSAGTQEELRYLARNHAWYTHTGTRQLTLDSSGNLGLGVTPNSGWRSAALQVAQGGFYASTYSTSNAQVQIFNNAYVASDTSFRYLNTGPTTLYTQNNGGGHFWYYAASGSAGAIISYTTQMTLDTSGNLLVGTTSNPGSYRMEVYGDAHFGLGSENRGIYLGPNGFTASLRYNSDGSLDIAPRSGYSIKFLSETGGSERARIDGSGQFMVGATSSSAKFLVAGNTGNLGVFTTSGFDSTCQVMIQGSNNANRDASLYLEMPGLNGGGMYLHRATNTLRVWIGGNSSGVSLAPNATSWGTFSDERLKDIIEPIENAAEKVSSLRAVIGRYKTDEPEKRRTFLIAQDVKAVLPEAVYQNSEEDDTLSLAYTDTIPLLVAAIKELKAELDSVKSELATIKGAA